MAPDLLFATTAYTANALSIATALSAIAIGLLGSAVVVRGRGRGATPHFLVLAMMSSGWLGGWVMMYAASEAEVALVWARVGYAFGVLIPAAMYQFAVRLFGTRREAALASGAWIACGALAAFGVSNGYVMSGVRLFRWGYFPVSRPAAVAVTTILGIVMVGAIHIFWRAYRDADGKGRERSGMLLLATAFGALGVFDYLPSMGIDLQPGGYLTMLVYIVLAAVAVWRFELEGITPEFAATQILETMKGAVMVVDMDGRIRVVNGGAAQLLGYRKEALRGMHIRQIFPRDANLTTGQLLSSLGILEHTMAWRAADGTTVDVLAASSFLRDLDNRPVAVIYVASDFTERKRADGALRESEHRYRALFEMNPLPMWVYDYESLRFTDVNDEALRHYGYSRDEFLSMTIRDIRPVEELGALDDALRNAASHKGPRLFRHCKKDGTAIDVEITSFEFVAGRRRSRLVIAQDVTTRLSVEDEVRRSEERYRELFENANDVVFTHDLSGIVTSMNLAGERIGGYSRDEVIGTHIQELLVPEHRHLAQEAMEKKLRGEAAFTAYEVQMRAKDGHAVPLELSTRLIYEHGKPAAVQGIGRDVAERKASEARYRLLFERNLAGVYRSTVGGQVLDCNDACARLFGFPSREGFLACDARELYFDETDRQRVVQLLRDEQQVTNMELKMRRQDGSEVWVLENVTLSDDEVMEGTIIDITDRKRAQEQVEYQAYHDALTGLPNRLLFRDRINIALAHAKRNVRLSAVMFLDLDQFKLVNDTLGHTVGDRLLQAIGARLVTCVRAGDTVARMGGDEFTILLPDLSDRRGATLVAQKLQAAVRQQVVIDEHELHVTTSIGIAMYPDDGTDAETLLKNADRAMYRAKDLGRANYQFADAEVAEAEEPAVLGR